MAFDKKVVKYVGTTAGMETLSVDEALSQGIDYVLGIVKSISPQNLPLFGRKVTIKSALTTGYVSGITLTSGGSGYASNATLAFSGGGGTGAQGWITLTSANGSVVNGVGLGTYGSPPVSKTGAGYTSAPTASVVSNSGSGATFTVSVVIKDGMDLGGLDIFDILKVERDGYVAQPAKADNIHKMTDTKSIYYAQSGSPTYITDFEGILRIYPDTSASEQANIYCISSADGKVIDKDAETITDKDLQFGTTVSVGEENFPSIWKELVVLHASELLLVEKIGQSRESLPTDLDTATTVFGKVSDVEISVSGLTKALPSNFSISTALPSPTVVAHPTASVNDALNKAMTLMDSAATIGGDDGSGGVLSVQKWLEDEDEDMVQATIQAITSELSRAQNILQDHQAKVQVYAQDFTSAVTKYTTEISKEAQRVQVDISEYQAELAHAIQQKQNELQEYQANLGKSLQLYTNLIQKVSTEYGWLTQQLQIVGSKKQEFIQAIQPTGRGESPMESTV